MSFRGAGSMILLPLNRFRLVLVDSLLIVPSYLAFKQTAWQYQLSYLTLEKILNKLISLKRKKNITCVYENMWGDSFLALGTHFFDKKNVLNQYVRATSFVWGFWPYPIVLFKQMELEHTSSCDLLSHLNETSKFDLLTCYVQKQNMLESEVILSNL